MSTMKYKMSGRYAVGWSDYRGGIGAPPESMFATEIPVMKDHFSTHMSTEQLRAAWLLEYGDRVVPLFTLAEDGDMYNIGRQLYARGQLYEERRPDLASQCYYLKRESDGEVHGES